MNYQEILTSTERDENTERKDELIKLVASGEAVLIVGAGSSVRVGYPDWQGLLDKLEDLASKWDHDFKLDGERRETAPLAYAEEIKSHIHDKTGNRDRYYNLLYELFQPKPPVFNDFHKTLVSLPFRSILTTNYDMVLEAALGEIESLSAYDNSLVIDDSSAGRVHEFLMAIIDASVPRRIAHLHGRYDNPKSLILSSKDYQKAYGFVAYEDIPELNNAEKVTDLTLPDANQVQSDSKWTLHRKLLWALLATRRAVFIGFSMKDPYLNRMLDAVSKDLWRWDKSIHYAIMGISPERTEYSKAQEFKRDYGIDTVFYEVFDNLHEGLDDIVNEIAKKCGVQILDWLEQTNQRMERRMGDEN